MAQGVSMEECIRNCTECHRICLETLFTHCLPRGGEHAEAGHVRLMADCAEICQTSANFMIRGSELQVLTCGACAEICARCADDCEKMDDERMKACAETCRRCSALCRAMAQGAP